MQKKYIIALDEGTTSARTVVYSTESHKIVATDNCEFTQYYPYQGWVEHDANEIWHAQMLSYKNALEKAGISADEIAAIGITNQRETVVAWDKLTGEPLYNAIVWQCRRTAELTEKLKLRGFGEIIKQKTGLIPDAYFSATKIKWLLDNSVAVADAARTGRLMVGTIDSWLIYKLTGGAVHVTDYSNASRTMLYNIRTLEWDKDILAKLQIPEDILPKVVSSSGITAYTDKAVTGAEIPIAGICGDQQSALFGQGCFSVGSAKNTYGTGCFILMNTGRKPVYSKNNLLTTIAWGIDGQVEYALEGSVYNAGSVIKWLRDELGLIEKAADCNSVVYEVSDNGGVYLVPAFTGLGAPFWDMYARGTIVGLTRGANRKHIVRAAVESIAFQSKAVFDAMADDAELELTELKVDGGASVNDFLLQKQADLLGIPVMRPSETETTALGAIYLAGIALGVWKSTNEIMESWQLDRTFLPGEDREKCNKEYITWQRALERSLSWEE